MLSRSLPGDIEVRWTGCAQGDLGLGAGPQAEARRRRVVDRPWVWLRQVHGAAVVVTSRPYEVGSPADAMVAPATEEAALAVFTADCGPLALASPEGAMGAVHVGWAGLRAGVVGAAVDAMRELGASRVAAVLGPCIRPECYDFSPDDLEEMAQRLGPGVRGRTAWGTPALDLPAGVRRAAELAGVEAFEDLGVCTACASGRYWSHRARQEPQRQAMVVWRP